MALKKGVFEEYVKETKQSDLDNIIKRQYSHNRVFDSPPDVSDKQNKVVVKNINSSADESMLNIIEVDVSDIIRWKFKDRPENELGNIDELAETFKSVGQQQPCILRVSKEYPEKYELIVGERRWRAAEKAGLKLKAVVQDINDNTAALIQAIENEKRSDISDFAKGMSYADKIENGLLTQKDLIDILHISKQQVSRLLSYKRIPESLFNAIDDFRKVSARTANELARLASKGEDYLQILIEIADRIRDGKYGYESIIREVDKRLSKKESILSTNKKIIGIDGRHLFTWRLDNNGSPSIHFPRDFMNLISRNIISFDDLTQDIKECISKKIDSIKV